MMETDTSTMPSTASQSHGWTLSASVMLFGLMMSLPFLVPYHSAPIPSFRSEWLAVFLSLLGLFALILQKNVTAVSVPQIAMAPALLMLVVLAQTTLGMYTYSSVAVTVLIYLFWCVLIATGARTLRNAIGLEALAPQLAWFILAGGTANALFGLCQYFGIWQAFGGLICAPMSPSEFGIYGNLAQQNHFSTHIALAIASATYLFIQKRLSRPWYGSISIALLAALALSGSRSSVLHIFLISSLSILLLRKNSKIKIHKLAAWRSVAIAALAIGILYLLSRHASVIPQLKRVFSTEGAFGPRLYLWKHALIMFVANPLLGVGFESFAYHLVEQLYETRETVIWGIDQYAHNLWLQLLAVSGIAGIVAVALPCLLYARKAFRQPYSAERFWIWSVLGILLIHSMLEQPLYYAYFLGPCVFILGMSDSSPWKISLGTKRSTFAVALLILAVYFSLKTANDYSRIEHYLYSERFLDEPDPARLTERRNAALNLHAHSIFSPLTELAAPGEFVPADAPASEKISLNNRVMRFAPTAEVEFRHAALLAEAGRATEAIEQIKRAARAYPLEAAAYLQRFQQLAADDPSTYGAATRSFETLIQSH